MKKNRAESQEKKSRVANIIMPHLDINETITRKMAISLVQEVYPDIEKRHVDEWAQDHLVTVPRGTDVAGGRGVWRKNDGVSVIVPRPAPKSPPTGTTTSRRKTGPRMPETDRVNLAKAVANAMFLEVPKPIPHIIEQAAHALGLSNLPGNIISTIGPAFSREYEALVLDALTEKPVLVTERIVLDLSQAHPVDLLREVMHRGNDILKLLADLTVVHAETPSYIPTTTTPKPKAAKYRVLITGLLPSQVTDFQNRAKIKSNAHRLDLHFLAQDSTTLRIPSQADLVLCFRKMHHSLWHSMNAHYGRDKVHVLDGIHGIEEALLTGVTQWAK